MTWKPPSPGSIAPLPSCSPFSGKSSSNTYTVSVAVCIGFGCTFTVTGANVHTPAALQVGAAIGAPAIVWPQLDTVWPVRVWVGAPLDAPVGSDALPEWKESAQAPG